MLFTLRHGHTCVQTKNSCYLFGGVDTNTNELADNKVYKFTESTNELEDNLSNNPICIEIPDECFATKYHVMFEYENNIYVHGGKHSGVCGQLFMLNTSESTLEILNDADSDNCCRYGHSVVVCNDKAYFFGGKTHHETSNTLCVFDLTTKKWMDQPKANGEWPNELTFHTAVLYDEKMYVFGGKTKNDTPSGILYEINLKQGEDCFCRTLYRENAPSARFGHVCYVKQDSMHVLGGYSSVEEVDPWIAYKYSFTTNTWTSYRLETPCGVFASVLHAEKVSVIGGTFWNRIKSTDLELLNEDIFVSILQFLPIKEILEIQLLNKNLSLCHATQSDSLWQKLYKRRKSYFVTKPYVTSNFKQAYIDLQKEDINSLFDFDISAIDYPGKHKYIGLKSLLKTPLKKKQQTIKTVIVGAGAVGKTCLKYTLCDQWGDAEFGGHFYWHDNVELCKMEECDVSFWDTQGQEEYDRLRPLSYPQTTVFLVLFSPFVRKGEMKWDNEASSVYFAVHKFLQEVRYHCVDAPCILVGTKQDMRSEDFYSENYTVIPPIFGEHIARETNCIAYVDTSAKTGYSTGDLKRAIVRAAQFNTYKPKRKKICKLM